MEYSSLSNKRAAQFINFWKNHGQNIFIFSLIYDLLYDFHYNLMFLCLFWQLLSTFIIKNGLDPPYKDLGPQNYPKFDKISYLHVYSILHIY